MTEARNIIYGLVDPRTKLVRYVGCSSKGLRRPREHGAANALAKDRTHKAKWIRSLRRAGHDYEIVVLQESTAASLFTDERWWVAYGKASGWPLTNGTDGGEGMLGRVFTDETRAKLRASLRGRKMPPVSAETKAKIGAANRGKSRTAEQRAHLRAALSGRRHTPEAREKIRRASLGRKMPPESIAKTAAALRGRKLGPLTPAHREKIGAAQRGRPKAVGRTPEQRAEVGRRIAAGRTFRRNIAALVSAWEGF